MKVISMKKVGLPLAFIIVFTFNIVIGWYQINDSRIQKENEIRTIQDASWVYIEGVLSEAYRHAEEKANCVSGAITEGINNFYGDDYAQLAHDLDSLISPDLSVLQNNILLSTLAENLKGQYIYGIQKDTMDFMITLKKYSSESTSLQNGYVVADFNINCLTDVERKKFDEVASSHYNSDIAEEFFMGIINQRIPDAQTLKYIMVTQKFRPLQDEWKIRTMSATDLGILFYENSGDYSVLESIEFYYPVYIYWDKDLAQRELIHKTGEKNTAASQMVILQGFSLYDIIRTNSMHVKALQGFQLSIDEIENTYTRLFIPKILTLVGSLVAIMLLVILVAQVYNRTLDEINEGEEDEGQ